jgi:radical SAM protein with 4Fe4S-binding SPASM domain
MSTYPPPRYIQLYPTDRCNQDCTFCFNNPAKRSGDMSRENALHLLGMLVRHGVPTLDIMGGEPFLLPWMPGYLHKAVRRGITVNISTNGSLPEVMETCRGIPPQMLNIGVSLEGSTADRHNRLTCSRNFEKAIMSIGALVSLGLNPIVKTVVSGQNRDDIQSLIDLLKRLGVSRYYLIHMDLFSRKPDDRAHAMSFLEFMRFFGRMRARNPEIAVHRVHASCFEKASLPAHVRCAGGVKKLSVMPDGSVYPCNLFQDVPEYCVGNIFTDDFHEIWSNSRLDFFRYAGRNSCRMTGCENFASCTGGCPAHGYFHGKDMSGQDIRCMSR